MDDMIYNSKHKGLVIDASIDRIVNEEFAIQSLVDDNIANLDTKIDDYKNDTYTKLEVDTKLSGKADQSSIDSMSSELIALNEDIIDIDDSIIEFKNETNQALDNRYTREESDNRYSNALIGKASGETITLTDTTPLDASMDITLYGKTTEVGEGEKSPDNPHELVGVESATITISDGEMVQQSIPLTFNTPLYSLPNGVVDEITYDSYRRKKTHIQRVGVRTFNGSETWYIASSANDILFWIDAPEVAKVSDQVLGATSTHYSAIKYVDMYLDKADQGVSLHNQVNRLYFVDKRFDNVTDFKAELAVIKPTVLYQLSVPVITELPYDDADVPKSIHPTTVITATDQSDNALAMDVEYKRDINPAIENSCKLLSGTFAARPVSVTSRTIYMATDKAVGNADRLTINMGGSVWLQV